jgi:hypothetical protein
VTYAGKVDRRHWVAYLSEDAGEDERGPIATGLFSGHLEAGAEEPDSSDWTDDDWSIESVSVEAAIAWARERATRVILRLASAWDGPSYSAGETPIRGLPPWEGSAVALVRRRPDHWQFVDRTEQDDPISWDAVLCATQYEGDPVYSFGEELHRELDIDSSVELLGLAKGDERAKLGVSEPELGALTGYSSLTGYGIVTVRAKLRCRGRTVAEATELARRIAERAAARATPPDSRHEPRWDFDVYVYPTGSRLAAVNTEL